MASKSQGQCFSTRSASVLRPAGLSSLADAFLERRLQPHRLLTLLEHVLERLVGELLEGQPSRDSTASIACHVSSSN
jgi:hypothetical protein